MATKKQILAWYKVGYAIFKGRLVRKRCECGSKRFAIAHHNDYEEPLEVEFICRACHREIHQLNAFSQADIPELLETDAERDVVVNNSWEECLRIIGNDSSIKGKLKTAII